MKASHQRQGDSLGSCSTVSPPHQRKWESSYIVQYMRMHINETFWVKAMEVQGGLVWFSCFMFSREQNSNNKYLASHFSVY